MKHAGLWHPDQQQLAAFGSGMLGADDSSVVESHLSDCADCAARLLEFSADSLVARLQQVYGQASSGSSAESSNETPPDLDRAVRLTTDEGCSEPWPEVDVETHQMPATIGRFAVVQRIGTGGFGTVYKAYDSDLERHVAIKVPRPGVLRTPKHRERFLREARAAATLSHPRICPVHEVGHGPEVPYLVMPILEGCTLEQLIEQQQLPSPNDIIDLICSVAETLQHAHDKGIVHRDLKPGNILINDHGDPVIMDFGLAWRQTDHEIRLTGSREIMGTPIYMSPEQARGTTDATAATTDVYSLGVVLYQLLSGRPPFQGTFADLISQILQIEPQPPSRYRQGISPLLDDICLRCLAKDPSDRFQTMKQLAAALQAATTQRDNETPKTWNNTPPPVGGSSTFRAPEPTRCSPPSEAAMALRRRHRLAISAALVAVLGIVASVYVIKIRTETEEIEIRSFDPTLKIAIVRNGELAHESRVDRGQLVTKVRTGQIEIRIQGPQPDNIEIRNGSFRLRHGHREVVEILRRPRQTVSNEPAGDFVAQCLELGRTGKFSEVVRVATNAIQADPSLAAAYEIRARAQVELGNYQEAAADCDTALRLDPALDLAYVTSTQARLSLHRYDEVVRDATAGIQRQADSVPCYFNRGYAQAMRGQWNQALDDFTTVIRLEPQDARGYWHRAAVYKLLGEQARSQVDVQQAVTLQPQLATQILPDFHD